MAENWKIKQKVDLSGAGKVTSWPESLMMPGDSQAHEWSVEVTDNNVPVSLTGWTVTGYFDRADGETVAVVGSVSGNTATVTMEVDCYTVPGAVRATMRMAKSSAVTTLSVLLLNIGTAPGNEYVDPGEVIPTLATLAANCEAAAAAASAVATTSAAGLAPQATAPAAGLRNILGIDSGETGYANKALYDTTAPSTQAYGDSAAVGIAMTAARRDHKHAMPNNPAASTSAAGLAPQATAPAAGLRNVLGIDNAETGYANKPLFDATAPSTQAFGDAAAVGTAMTAARRDHKHAMPAVVDGLSSTSSTSALSAAQGKALNDAKANKAASPTAGNIATLDAGGNPSDSGTSMVSVASQLADLSPLARHTASLSVAQITPVPSSPLDATVKTVATQAGSGDPSPSNIRTITGRSSAKVKRTGKNLLENIFGKTSPSASPYTGDGANLAWTKNVDGSITVSGTVGSSTTLNIWMWGNYFASYNASNNLFILPAGTYTLKDIVFFGFIGGAGAVQRPFNTTTTTRFATYTFAKDFYVQGVRTLNATSTGETINTTFYPQLELGSVATAYEPYSGTELTLTPASTLYGLAGAEDEIGVDGHEVHSTALVTFNGTENWVREATSTPNKYQYSLASSPVALATNNASIAKVGGSHYTPMSANNVYLRTQDHSIAISAVSKITVYDASFEDETSVTAFKAWLAAQYAAGTPVQVLYQLATPTTAQGTAQTLAALAQADKYTPRLNNVYSDGGNVVVGYAKSPIQETIDAPLPAGTGNSWYTGRDLKALYGDAATFMAALRTGAPFDIRTGDYWPVTLNGTIRDVGSYTAPIGITYYSDTALTSSVGTTATAYEAAYVNATYCSIVVSGTTRYVSTAACLAYFARTLSNAVVNLEVAGINLYYNHGDTALAVPHILFCPRDCLPFYIKMRKTDAIWHSEATTNPWLGCAMYATLNDATYGLLPLIAATDIGAYIYGGPNGAGMRTLLPDMATGVGTPTGWAWRDRGKLFLPMEKEVWGSALWASHVNHQALSAQWPIFTGTLRHIVKGAGNAGTSTHWWCATATGATSFAYVNIYGFPTAGGAAYANGVAPCFLVA